MKPVIYLSKGELIDGLKLLGHHQWSSPRRLSAALVTVTSSANGDFLLQMFAGDVATNVFILVPSTEGEVTVMAAINYDLPANTPVRWMVTGSGFVFLTDEDGTILTDEDGNFLVIGSGPGGAIAHAISITLFAQPANGRPARQAMTVRWVAGSERLTVFTYDPATGVFTPTSFLGSRSAYGPSGGDSVWQVNGNASMALREGVGVVLNELNAAQSSVLGAEEPRIEFWIGEMRVGSLDSSGRLVVTASNTVAAIATDPTLDRFEFFSPAHELVAVLTPAGLGTLGWEQPL